MQRWFGCRLGGLIAALGLALAAPATAQVWKGGKGGTWWALALDGSGDVIAGGKPTYTGDLSVVRVAGASGAEIWRFESPWGSVSDMALGSPGGAVIAGGSGDFTVTRLSVADGTMVWRRVIDGEPETFFGSARAVALDAAGNAVASGDLDEDLTVVKLAAATGAELWRYSVHGQAVSSVVVDAAGDVIAGSDYFEDQFVVKLSGVDGTELWRHGLHGGQSSTYVRAFAYDSAGNVIGVGTVVPSGPGEDLTVFKLAGATGAELWRTTIDGNGHGIDGGRHVVVDAADDVIVTGSLESATRSIDAAIIKLAGASGTELWRYVPSGPARVGFGLARKAALDPSGDIVVVGNLGRAGTDIGVMKLAANDGVPRWLRQINLLAATGEDVAVDATGTVFVAANNRYGHPAILRFDGSTGGDYLVPNARLLVKDSAAFPSRRSLKFSASAAPELSQALRPGLADPTAGGAVLEMRNPTTGETAVMALPAARWQAVMSPQGLDGFRYEDPDLVDGPCRQVRVQHVRQQRPRLSADCQGAQLAFTLDEPAQGTLAVRLDVGAPTVRLCFTFLLPSQDRSTADGGNGVFKAKKSPTPDACP